MAGASRLDKTIFGDVEIKDYFIPTDKDVSVLALDALQEKESKIEYFFQAESDYVLFLNLNLNRIGTGGEGEYEIELKSTEKDASKAIYKTTFDIKDLDLYLQEDDYHRFEVLSDIKKGVNYRIKISNKNAKTDNSNYLQIGSMFGKEKNSPHSFASFTGVEFSRSESGEKILANSRLEDLGRMYSYSYENSGYVTDFFDIYESVGDVKYDWGKGLVVNKEKIGNFMTYKIDTIKPFKRMRFIAEQYDKEKDEILIQYSYDNEKWSEMDYSQKRDDSQQFDYYIKDNKDEKSIIYIRVSYNGKENKLSRTFGLKKIKIDAYSLK